MATWLCGEGSLGAIGVAAGAGKGAVSVGVEDSSQIDGAQLFIRMARVFLLRADGLLSPKAMSTVWGARRV